MLDVVLSMARTYAECHTIDGEDICWMSCYRWRGHMLDVMLYHTEVAVALQTLISLCLRSHRCRVVRLTQIRKKT